MKGGKKHEQTRFISTNSYDHHVVNCDSFVPISGSEHTNFCTYNYHSHFIFHLSVNQNTDAKEVNQKSHLNLTALADTNRTSQSARQSSLSRDLEQFKEQQRNQQRTISRSAQRRSKSVQRTNKDGQSQNDRRIATDKQSAKEQQHHVESPKRQPKSDRSRDYGPSR